MQRMGINSRKNKEKGRLLAPPALLEPELFAEAQTSNQSTITLNIYTSQVVEQVTALTYHLQQTTVGVMILLVGLQVLGQVTDTLGQYSNLYFGRCLLYTSPSPRDGLLSRMPSSA